MRDIQRYSVRAAVGVRALMRATALPFVILQLLLVLE